MAEAKVDRLVILIAYQWQTKNLIKTLTEHQFATTVVDAAGGLMREGMVTLVVGTSARRLPSLLSFVRDACPSSTRYIPYDADTTFPWQPECEVVVIRAGGATAFILPVEQFVQL